MMQLTLSTNRPDTCLFDHRCKPPKGCITGSCHRGRRGRALPLCSMCSYAFPQHATSPWTRLQDLIQFQGREKWYEAKFCADDAPDWNPATFLRKQRATPGLQTIVLEVEISRDKVPIRNAYKHVGQRASVRVDSGIDRELAGKQTNCSCSISSYQKQTADYIPLLTDCAGLYLWHLLQQCLCMSTFVASRGCCNCTAVVQSLLFTGTHKQPPQDQHGAASPCPGLSSPCPALLSPAPALVSD